jgi:hypothetical protein
MKDLKIAINGHITIKDILSGEILLSKHNACHFENLSVAIAESLSSGTLNASDGQGFIYAMAFGNGGTTVSSTGIVTYNPPHTIGSYATLYNQTYSKVINNQFSANTDIDNNNISWSHIPGKAYTDIIINCQLDYGEPSGQHAFDNSNSLNTEYAFDEIGLTSLSGLLLTHVIFSPILKSSNRLLNIAYTLRISTLSSLTV